MNRQATVVRIDSAAVVVECPYGGHKHVHDLADFERASESGETEEIEGRWRIVAKCSTNGKRFYYVDLERRGGNE